MKEVLRMCIVCRQMVDKNKLIRVVKLSDGTVKIDKVGKENGRGAYVCRCNECLEKLKKNKLLNKAFKMQVTEEIYNTLMSKEF